MSEQKKQSKRTLSDKAICQALAWYYSLTEPARLMVERLLHDREYADAKEDPLITVYTPTYNRAEILRQRALPTVLAQTYKNFEFIIVGDHCTDNTEEVVRAANDPRIRFYNIPKRGYRYPPTAENHWLAGPVVAANQGLSMARGKWVARIDDDDLWTEDHLESLLRFAQNGNFEFVSASYVAERYGEKKVIDVAGEEPRIGGTQTWLYRSYLLFMKYNINCWRKSWNRVNDTDLQDRIYKAGTRMGFLEKVVAYVLPRPNEETIGLDAYRKDAEEKMEHFKFE